MSNNCVLCNIPGCNKSDLCKGRRMTNMNNWPPHNDQQTGNTSNNDMGETRIDWSTPYDEWLIPLLNKARYCSAIEFRAIPSVVQLEISKLLAAQDLTSRIDTITKIFMEPTEGLFDNGDLFVKRKPIEQVCINLIGYEAYKAITEAATAATEAALQSKNGGK